MLADLLTVREFNGGERSHGLKMCYIGDGNNMANSLIVGGLTVGMSGRDAPVPEAHQPRRDVLAFATGYDGKF